MKRILVDIAVFSTNINISVVKSRTLFIQITDRTMTNFCHFIKENTGLQIGIVRYFDCFERYASHCRESVTCIIRYREKCDVLIVGTDRLSWAKH